MFGLREWIDSFLYLENDLRAESWALGGRHHGDVLKGARAELADRTSTTAKRSLLRAVIRRQLRSNAFPSR